VNILVTGGAGFIGSHLCEALLRRGHRIAIIDDLNDFYSPVLKRMNVDVIQGGVIQGVLPGSGAVEFHLLDICDREGVLKVAESFQPNAIIHLAARAGVRPSLAEPFLYERVNVHGTLVMLEAARIAGAKKFVFASSSSVYGVTTEVPFREDDASVLPISPYAATKIAGEKLCYTWSRLYGIDCVCLRFFTVFGPRQRPDLAIRKFVEHIRDGRPIPVYGDLSNARDYTFVGDIVQGITAALNLSTPYEIFNLGNSAPVTLEEMIATIERVLRKKAILQRLPAQPGDVPLTYADISKAEQLLGYRPATSLEDGLRQFISWYEAGSQDAVFRETLTTPRASVMHSAAS
jgi:UDP-glucuronate 4-epimerase